MLKNSTSTFLHKSGSFRYLIPLSETLSTLTAPYNFGLGALPICTLTNRAVQAIVPALAANSAIKKTQRLFVFSSYDVIRV